jgi:hypothetical protein
MRIKVSAKVKIFIGNGNKLPTKNLVKPQKQAGGSA